MRVRGVEGDMDSKLSPGRKLQKARQKVYGKELALLAGLRQHAQFTAWEPTVGGKFPRETYDSIISEIQKSALNTNYVEPFTDKSLQHPQLLGFDILRLRHILP